MTKTSATKPLKGFEWSYTGTIATFKQQGYEGKGVSRTAFFSPDISQLQDIPEEMFMVKNSQSQKQELAGKPVFKFISFKVSEESGFNSLAPEGITLTTPLAEVKSTVISKLSNIPTAQVSIRAKLHGRFTTISTAEGDYKIYDEDNFPSDNWKELGEPPYFLRNDVEVTVRLKGAESHGNEYLQTRLSTTLGPDDIFQKKAGGKIWGEEEGVSNTEPAEQADDGGW